MVEKLSVYIFLVVWKKSPYYIFIIQRETMKNVQLGLYKLARVPLACFPYHFYPFKLFVWDEACSIKLFVWDETCSIWI